MPRKIVRPMERLCVRVFEDDAAYLREKTKENTEVGFNELFREIVSSYVKQMRALENRMIDQADQSFQKELT